MSQPEEDIKTKYKNLYSSITKWRDMSDSELRLRAGELTAQEIRNIRAILNAILPPER